MVDELDFEAIFQAYLADFTARNPGYDALVESDPAIILLQTMAYREKLNDEDVRPLTYHVTVQIATIVSYAVEAVVHVYPGPSFSVVAETSRANLERYAATRHAIWEVVAISGIYEALHVEGVRKIDLISPVSDIMTGDTEDAFCETIELNTAE